MTRILSIIAVVLPLLAHAHVGSPNVFFEGQAGAYPLHVLVRPPGTLPGFAQVDVRPATDGVTNVFVQAALWESGREGAPLPARATAVAGESNLFNAALWLMRNGSYSVRVTLEGRRGIGTTLIPLNAAPTRAPSMGPLLRMVLPGLGILLLIGAVWLVGAAARDSVLACGAWPTHRDRSRARIATVCAGLLFTGAVGAVAVRWRAMDREFRSNALSQPVPVAATVRTNGTLRLLQVKPARNSAGLSSWDTLVADHGKLMHLFLVREPDFNAFAHLHPVRRDDATFENVLPPLPSGTYQLYAEITHENGLSETLTANLPLAAPAGNVPQRMGPSNMLNEVFCLPVVAPASNAPQPFALDADDSWHAAPANSGSGASRPQTSALMGGYRMTFLGTGELVEGRETALRFAVSTPEGQPASLEPYMGMLGHAVVRRADGAVFTHLHPVGTISMAAQQLFEQRERGELLPDATATNGVRPMTLRAGAAIPNAAKEVSFPYAFPRPGNYRLWVQVRTGGRVLTGVFDVIVRPGR
jgi:hypothetical protein